MQQIILDLCHKYNIDINDINRYNEPHRFYHNMDHIINMINQLNNSQKTDEILLAILFHDIIYDPLKKDNEEQSAELFMHYANRNNYKNSPHIKQAILETKNHESTFYLSNLLCSLDLSCLYSDFKTFIEYEHKIFKEYQFVDYSIYLQKRVELLKKYTVEPNFVDYVKTIKPNIAVYAGSFNPFHKGHLNILHKAEQIFDKVIIARGINPDKNNKFEDLPDYLKYHQIAKYDGLLTDYLNSLSYEVTLIRGLRNSTDLQYELSQYRYLQDLNPKIKVVSLFCDREYEHISSSAIRILKQYNKDQNYLV